MLTKASINRFARATINIALLAIVVGLGLHLALEFRTARKLSAKSEAAATTQPVDPGPAAEEQEHVLNAGQLKKILDSRKEHPLILDVRQRYDFIAGHIPSAVNIPFDELEVRAEDELQPAAFIVISYCECDKHNTLSQRYRALLNKLGFKNVAILDNGIDGWKGSSFALIASS